MKKTFKKMVVLSLLIFSTNAFSGSVTTLEQKKVYVTDTLVDLASNHNLVLLKKSIEIKSTLIDKVYFLQDFISDADLELVKFMFVDKESGDLLRGQAYLVSIECNIIGRCNHKTAYKNNVTKVQSNSFLMTLFPLYDGQLNNLYPSDMRSKSDLLIKNMGVNLYETLGVEI